MTPPPFPRLRWAAAAFLAVYVPAYALAYGLANFLFLCNLSVILAGIGLWTGSRVAAVAGFLVLLVYPLTHVLLVRLCPGPRAGSGRVPPSPGLQS